MKKRIRFWVYTTSPIRITLQAGQALHHSAGGSTDEGWWLESNIWSFDGHRVTNVWCSAGRDCDGCLTRHGETSFHARDAAAGYREESEGIAYPLWSDARSSQRDEYAEASGY